MMPAHKPTSRLKLFVFKFLGATLSVVCALAIAEIVVRVTNYRPGTMDANMYVATANPLLAYRLRPNYAGISSGSEVKVDADGNRIVNPSYQSIHSEPNVK